MIRANLMVGVVSAGLLALLLGTFVIALGPGPALGPTGPGGTADSGPGGPPESAPAAEPGRAESGPPMPRQEPVARPVEPAPPPAVVVTGRSGGATGATGSPGAACTPNLLQTMLGLVTATLGGPGAC